jgi:hypothetical protein
VAGEQVLCGGKEMNNKSDVYDITAVVGSLASHPKQRGIVIAPSVAAAKIFMGAVSQALLTMQCQHVSRKADLEIEVNGAVAKFAGGDPDGLRGMSPAWVYCMDSDLFKESRWEEVHRLVGTFLVIGADVIYA